MDKQVMAAISAIRAIGQIWPDDVQAIVACLSSKVAHDINCKDVLHVTSVDILDSLADYLSDEISLREQAAEYTSPKPGYVHTVANIPGVSLERAQ